MATFCFFGVFVPVPADLLPGRLLAAVGSASSSSGKAAAFRLDAPLVETVRGGRATCPLRALVALECFRLSYYKVVNRLEERPCTLMLIRERPRQDSHSAAHVHQELIWSNEIVWDREYLAWHAQSRRW